MWAPTTRKLHDRKTDRYQSDLTDEEWHAIEPHSPAAGCTGRPRAWSMREIVNGVFHVTWAGCPRLLLPSGFPPWETVYCWFAAWRDDGRFETINHLLAMADRERAGREASPAGVVIDSRSAKSTEAGGPRDYDDGNKINGRKRHAPVDSLDNCMRTLALPSAAEPWSLTSLREKLIKIGAKVARHGR